MSGLVYSSFFRLISPAVRIVIITLFIGVLFAGEQLQAQTITAQGFWGRGQDTSFTLDVTMNIDVNIGENPTGIELFTERFWLRLPGLRNAVLRVGATSAEGARLTFVLQNDITRIGNNIVVQAQLRIDANSIEVFNDMQTTPGVLPFETCVLREGSSEDCATTLAIQQATQRLDAVCDNPVLGALTTPFQSLGTQFSFPDRPVLALAPGNCFSNPPVTNQDYSPTSAYVFLIDATSGISTLSAKTFTGTATDTSSQCGVTLGINGQSCVSCAQDTYLDIPAILASTEVSDKSIQIKEVEITESSTAFTGLDLNSNYTAFATYNFGLKTSTCFTAAPGDDKNAFELLGETDTELGSECFIATVAYGTGEHPDLDVLRWFRDEVLMQQGVGRSLVGFYYSYGPTAAEWLADKPRLRRLVRWSLFPVVLGVRGLQWLLHDS